MGRLNEKRGKKKSNQQFSSCAAVSWVQIFAGRRKMVEQFTTFEKWWCCHFIEWKDEITKRKLHPEQKLLQYTVNATSFYKHLHSEEPRVGVSWPLVSSQSPTGNKGSDEPSGSASISTCTCFNSRISVCLKAPWVGFQLCHMLSLQKKKKNLTASVMIGVCVTVCDVA